MNAHVDYPTGTFPAPLNINGKPVYDVSDPNAPKLAVLQPGQKYTVVELAAWWIVTHTDQS